MRSDGSYVGRSAPEIDVLEAIVDGDGGKVSLSAQWAPYNVGYLKMITFNSKRRTGWLQLV